MVLNSLSWERRTWLPETNFKHTSTLGKMNCVYRKRNRSRSFGRAGTRYLHAGGTVFIPANTWVDIKNAGTERVSGVFVFSAPGFENLHAVRLCPAKRKSDAWFSTRAERVQPSRTCHLQGHVVANDWRSAGLPRQSHAVLPAGWGTCGPRLRTGKRQSITR
jgi:hypothetical protein